MSSVWDAILVKLQAHRLVELKNLKTCRWFICIGMLKLKDYDEYFYTCFQFCRANTNLSNASNVNVCMLWLLFVFLPTAGCRMPSDTLWQISYGRSAVTENSPPQRLHLSYGAGSKANAVISNHALRKACRGRCQTLSQCTDYSENHERFSRYWL